MSAPGTDWNYTVLKKNSKPNKKKKLIKSIKQDFKKWENLTCHDLQQLRIQRLHEQ